MNSKEALENLTYCVNGMESKEKYYKIIKQDLDRLEELEKVINILKNKTVVIGALKISRDLNDYNEMTHLNNLTQEEYELLKEVFKNE